MRLFTFLIVISALLGAPHVVAQPHVVLSTPHGDIVIAVDTVAAPLSAHNFLAYVDSQPFDSAAFFRTVTPDNQPNDSIRIAVIQGAFFGGEDVMPPVIAHETTAMTGLRHLNGTVSMARSAPGTARNHFFICVGDQPSLDYGGLRNPDGQGFAAFGQVVDGMDVVYAIHRQPYVDQRLTPDVPITQVARQ